MSEIAKVELTGEIEDIQPNTPDFGTRPIPSSFAEAPDRSMGYHERHNRAFLSLMNHIDILMEQEQVGVPSMEGLLDLAKRSIREELEMKNKKG